MPGFRIRIVVAALAGLLLTAQAPAPAPPPSGSVAPPAEAPKPVEAAPPAPPAAAAPVPPQAAPSPPPASPPAPQSTQAPAAPPAPGAAPPAQQAQPAPPPGPDATATLAPGVTDPTGADEVMLPGKPAASLRGSANWEGGYAKIKAALDVIRAEMARAGVKPAGRPLTVFLTADDEKFTFEAMVPIDPAAPAGTSFGADVKLTQTPAGRAIRFGHKGAYDNIDETYEVLTAYLDAKGIDARDAFIEEYLTENLGPSDENFELHIYVQPK
jgi:effector-binding domain-containing protein